MTPLAWPLLAEHARRLTNAPPTWLQETARRADFSAALGPLSLDYSRQWLDRPARAALLQLAEQADVGGWRDRMLAGSVVNDSEARPAAHAALRAPQAIVAGADCTASLAATRQQMMTFATQLRARQLADGADTILWVGLGGSVLGPQLLCQALPGDGAAPTFHFLTAPDPVALDRVLTQTAGRRCLAILVSKSYTTAETSANVAAVRAARPDLPWWVITARRDLARADGIPEAQIFDLPLWVGGRFSIWSAVGLPLSCNRGPQAFSDFLAGARVMDRHFATAPFAENLPVLLGLLLVWNSSVLRLPALAVLPYDQRLARLPAYLQQLLMESLGKAQNRTGAAVGQQTCPVVFGEPGTDCQHSFMQLLHQGTVPVAVDLLVTARMAGNSTLCRLLHENAIAQAAALSRHGRPVTVLGVAELNPQTLGMLLALYEHAVLVAGALWDLNPFDQPGVELGKQLAGQLREGAGDPLAQQQLAALRGS